MITVHLQEDNFDSGSIHNSVGLHRTDIGAKISFTGIVKDFFDTRPVNSLYIEHYPSMAEKQLKRICQSALERWNILEIHLVHRFGLLEPGDNIVNLVLASKGRDAAFSGGMFIMDYLKSDAPFWKKEYHSNGDRWVDQKSRDLKQMDAWDTLT